MKQRIRLLRQCVTEHPHGKLTYHVVKRVSNSSGASSRLGEARSGVVPVVTIDGPSGSGKGTVSNQLAKSLNWHFLDSGAIYRAFAFIAHETSTPIEEGPLLALIEPLTLHLKMRSTGDTKPSVEWKEQDITGAIRGEHYGNLASRLAVFPKLRQALLAYQRAFRQPPGLVADGRDMGTVVFPDASLKIFLSATPKERIKRRYLQLKAAGKRVSLSSVRTALERRDHQDEQRSAAPLRAAEDAFVIDTTHLGVEDVLRLIKDRLYASGGIGG